MNTNYIYLDNIEYEGKGQLFAKVPTGLKYNCFNCKKNYYYSAFRVI